MLRLWGFDEMGFGEGVLFLLISREDLRFLFLFLYVFGTGYLGGHGVHGGFNLWVVQWTTSRRRASDTTRGDQRWRFPGFLLEGGKEIW